MDAVSSRVLLGASGAGDQPWGYIAQSRRNNAICWDGSKFIAAGDDSFFCSSTDGVFWTSGFTASNSVDQYGVASSGSLTVVVGVAGLVRTSPDLINWTQQTSGTTSQLNAITWTGSLFVAVGSSGRIITSPDAVTWTTQTSGTTTTFNAVTWTGSLLVAVGNSGIIFTSPDGTTWTSQTSGTGETLRGVAASGSIIVAVGGPSSVAIIRTSTDGVTWTSRTAPVGAYSFQAITWSGALFVATEFELAPGTGATYSSSDGITWTLNSSGLENQTAIASSPSLFVVLTTQSLYTSASGTGSWVLKDLQYGYKVFTGNNVFVSSDLNEICTSTNGIDWSAFSVAAADGSEIRALIFAGNQYVIGTSTATIYTSPDGITWTQRVAASTNNFAGVAYSGSTYVMVGGTSAFAGFARTSPDGITWTTRTTGSAWPLTSVAWGNGLFVTVNTSEGKIFTSPTGTTWTLRYTPASAANLNAVIYANGVYLAVGEGAVRSTDGVTWTAVSPNPFSSTGAAFGVAWNGRAFVAVAGSTILSSRDGLTWATVLSRALNNLGTVAYLNGRTLAAGQVNIYYTLAMSPRPPTPPYPTI